MQRVASFSIVLLSVAVMASVRDEKLRPLLPARIPQATPSVGSYVYNDIDKSCFFCPSVNLGEKSTRWDRLSTCPQGTPFDKCLRSEKHLKCILQPTPSFGTPFTGMFMDPQPQLPKSHCTNSNELSCCSGSHADSCRKKADKAKRRMLSLPGLIHVLTQYFSYT
ncbi:MAG: hypothetical protein MHM6MM_007112, partial [Cercozoa sp. M6MM]